MSDCPYLQQIHRALPRLLACFDRDPTSQTFGVGDRFYWAWKLIDFPNGSFQGAAGGLARLAEADLLPEWLPRASALRRIDACFIGTASLTASNGSLDEALPREASFCVTALVAAELLDALRVLESQIDPATHRRWLETVAPLTDFLHRQDEHHGLISNHLATAAWALFLWSALSGETNDARARLFLDRVLDHQSSEGWFPEYGGMDAGYQTWCLGSLSEISAIRPDLSLNDRLRPALSFLAHCAHPDGSFGGLYGSRMTRFLLPGGVEALAGTSGTATALARFARTSIAGQRCVTLDAVDAPNLVPFFNDYCRAAARRAGNPCQQPPLQRLPFEASPFRRQFEDAGLLVDRGVDHYTIVSTRKGGLFLHFPGDGSRREDPGYIGRTTGGGWIAAQHACAPIDLRLSDASVEIEAWLRPVERPYPDPLRFIVLRMLSLSVFRSLRLGNRVKRLLARHLVARQPRAVGRLRRRINLGTTLEVDDRIDGLDAEPLADPVGFSATHMASQGYWQRSDDEH